jgi:hypothetical protein
LKAKDAPVANVVYAMENVLGWPGLTWDCVSHASVHGKKRKANFIILPRMSYYSWYFYSRYLTLICAESNDVFTFHLEKDLVCIKMGYAIKIAGMNQEKLFGLWRGRIQIPRTAALCFAGFRVP